MTTPDDAVRTPRTGWASDWSRLYRACAVGASRQAAPASSAAVTGSAASRAVLCAARRCEALVVLCCAALVLAFLTATPAPTSAAMTSTASSPASARRRHRPRARARPLARRKSASLVLSAGYRPGSASQTRAACRVAVSWTPRYSSARSPPLERHRVVSSASWPYRIMLVSSSSSQPRSRGHACSRTSCAISARSVSSTSRRPRANASRTASTSGHSLLGRPECSSRLVAARRTGRRSGPMAVIRRNASRAIACWSSVRPR